eukprot:m.234294 g.234294  ORF g.234294 m.234294 type:complete len:753 (+) comp33654_c1_seq2:188-2446(+)
MSAGKEVVFSVEETNKIRAGLGLKPLEVNDDKPDDGVVAPGTAKMDNDVLVAPVLPGEARRSEELRTKLSTTKEKRKLQKKLQKVKLLSDAGDEDESASSWIKKSRAKINTAKVLAALKEKELQEMDADMDEELPSYTAKDLAGIKVRHDKADIDEGSQVILTLADSSVLDAEDDVLENANLKQNSMYKKSVENKKGIKQYKAYEEDEFNDDDEKVEKKLLSKYDNFDAVTGNEIKKEDGGFLLDDDGGADLAREREQKAIRAKLKKQTQSLETETSLGTDFYTADEMTQFKKKKRRKVRKPKKKMLTADDLLPMDEEENQPTHGSRASRDKTNATNNDKDEATGGTSIAGVAKAVAALKSSKASSNGASENEGNKEPKMKLGALVVPDDDDDEDDDMDTLLDDTGVDEAEEAADAEIQATIERARKVALQRRGGVSSAQAVATAVQKIAADRATEGGGESDIVLTTMQEFVNTVGRDEAEAEKMKAEKAKKAKTAKVEQTAKKESSSSSAAAEPTTTTTTTTTPTEQTGDAMEVDTQAPGKPEEAEEDDTFQEGSGWTKVDEAKDEEDDDVEDEDDGDDWKAEATVSRSIMASVAFSQMRGFLEDTTKEVKNKKDTRSKDGSGREDRRTGDRDRDTSSSRANPLDLNGYAPTIKLEYRDDSGRLLMDQKERFRYISHKFHGKGSGKRKQEKRMNKQMESEASKKMDSGDTPFGATEIMRKRMETTGQAHVVIQGSVKDLNPKKKRRKKDEN